MEETHEKLRCTKEPYIEEVGPRRIKSIRFCTLSGEEIKKAAEVNVWTSRIYGENMKPIESGLLDLRMGPANKAAGKCLTCHSTYADCPGHFGYSNLVLPVYNVGFFSLVLDIMKCICKGCSRILLQDKDRRAFLKKMRNPRADALQKQNLVKTIRDRCKTSICPWCGFKNGTVKKKAPMSIMHDFSKGHDKNMDEISSALSHKKEKFSFTPTPVLDPLKVLSLLKGMVAEDCELLNLEDRPEKLMVTTVAVPPCPIRPSSLVSFSRASNEDSLTSILKDIINWNSILREHLDSGDPPNKCIVTDAAWGLLQNRVAEYINSESPCVFDPKGRGIVQRLKGKQGRFRGNLSGKRVEYTGRTVISPDPNLKITEVGIPVLMAKILSYPERVSYHNIEKLRQRIRNGPTKHPGANFVVLANGRRLHMKYADKKSVANDLKYGDVVERHLEDGDVVLFNRQPSLHRMSIMSHRARIMPWRTLRFNESVCNPYNADFDGDEMNMHVPQTEEARTEALMLMGVQNNLCTPKNGEILVASTQDFLTTSFLITRKDTFYDRATFSLLCSYMGDSMESIDLPTPALIKPIELWTGKQLFSVLIRPNAKTRVFLNLILLERNYNKKAGRESMCPTDGYVYFRNSELICGQVGKTTLGNGNKDGLYSVLLRDYNAHAAASCMNRLAKFSARWIGNHGISIGVDDVQPGEELNKQKNEKIEDGYKECEGLISSFSVGNLKPVAGLTAAETLEKQVMGVLSKIREDAGEVCKGVLHWRNSPLIMYQCGSKGSLINISQMVACVGQQSVGGKRAPNGFIDRTLPHFPVNSKTPAAKGFVANSFYTGLTPTEFFFHTMGGREGLVDTAVKTAETGYMSRRLMKGLEDLSVYYDQTVRNANGGIVQFVYGDDGMDPAKMEGKDGFPLNLDQLFMKVMATCPRRDQGVLSPSDILRVTNERLSRPDISSESSSGFKKSIEDFVNKRVEMFEKTRKALELDDKYTSVKEKFAANISGISAKQLEVFLETCISRYQLKAVEAGASMGAIGAQSIGEPGTQMTLKTFHFAGVASMNVTLGVPRIKEIINAAKNISTPIIEARLLSEKQSLAARLAKSRIEKTVLGDVARSIEVVFDAGQPNVFVSLDLERVKKMHLEIDADSVHGAILRHPKMKLKAEHVRVIGNDELRIYPPEVDRSRLQNELHNIKSMLPKVTVKGIPTAERVVIHKKEKQAGTKKENKKEVEDDGTKEKKKEVKDGGIKEEKKKEMKEDGTKEEIKGGTKEGKTKIVVKEEKKEKVEGIKKIVVKEEKKEKVEGKKKIVVKEEKVEKREKVEKEDGTKEEKKKKEKVEKEDGTKEEKKEEENKKDGTEEDEIYKLFVEGTNFLAVLGTPGIDPKTTKSNHIMEVQKTLGIEAARQCIINEIKECMDSYGMTIDIRHMKLLADLMTYKGEVLGITRFGITKMKDSVLMLASFEKTSEHLFNASYSGREDQIEGVSECIIMGIPMQLGTGILKLRQRLDSMPEFKYQPDPIMS